MGTPSGVLLLRGGAAKLSKIVAPAELVLAQAALFPERLRVSPSAVKVLDS
jgi:hypothetical protein